MQMYQVSKLVRCGQWEKVSVHASIEDAEKAARKLCPTGEVETEPGDGLERKYFGAASSKLWNAKIEPISEPPYLRQRHVEAIIDIASDGTLAGVELIDNMPPPPLPAPPRGK